MACTWFRSMAKFGRHLEIKVKFHKTGSFNILITLFYHYYYYPNSTNTLWHWATDMTHCPRYAFNYSLPNHFYLKLFDSLHYKLMIYVELMVTSWRVNNEKQHERLTYVIHVRLNEGCGTMIDYIILYYIIDYIRWSPDND